MKRFFLIFSIAITLFFSAYCSYYLDSQDVLSKDLASAPSITTDVNPEEDSELYFPDVAFVEKISALFGRMLRVF